MTTQVNKRIYNVKIEKWTGKATMGIKAKGTVEGVPVEAYVEPSEYYLTPNGDFADIGKAMCKVRRKLVLKYIGHSGRKETIEKSGNVVNIYF